SRVGMIATVPTLLVFNPSVPAKNFKEFLALAKAKPGTIYYGSAGNGSSGHLAMEYLKQAANIELTHAPYQRHTATNLQRRHAVAHAYKAVQASSAGSRRCEAHRGASGRTNGRGVRDCRL